MTLLSQLLPPAAQQLRDAGIDGAMGDARVLLAHAAGIAPDRLTLHLADPATPEVTQRFAELIARRAARVPVSHLLGYRLFWGRRFAVSPDVLDPRPETEDLIAAALSRPFGRVLDLGTGSGCILLTLLAERPAAQGFGVDLSPAALQMAARNAEGLGVADRVSWGLGSWFAPVRGSFDLIVSNPPYIAADEMAQLSPEVRLHEPRMALTDEADGLTHYRVIAAQSPGFLSPGGRLMVEIGPTQGPAVAGLLQAAGFQDVALRKDLDGRDRVVSGVAPNAA